MLISVLLVFSPCHSYATRQEKMNQYLEEELEKFMKSGYKPGAAYEREPEPETKISPEDETEEQREERKAREREEYEYNYGPLKDDINIDTMLDKYLNTTIDDVPEMELTDLNEDLDDDTKEIDDYFDKIECFMTNYKPHEYDQMDKDLVRYVKKIDKQPEVIQPDVGMDFDVKNGTSRVYFRKKSENATIPNNATQTMQPGVEMHLQGIQKSSGDKVIWREKATITNELGGKGKAGDVEIFQATEGQVKAKINEKDGVGGALYKPSDNIAILPFKDKVKKYAQTFVQSVVSGAYLTISGIKEAFTGIEFKKFKQVRVLSTLF
jgi:hypothetical protein